MTEFFIILALILLNGVFSMAEVAVISSRRTKLESQARKGSLSAKKVLKISRRPEQFLSTVQIGITIIALLTGIYSGNNIASRFTEVLILYDIPYRWAYSLSIIVVVVIVTYLSVVLGELFPKRVGLNNPEKIAKILVPLMQFLSWIFYPFVWLFSISTRGLVRLFRITTYSEGDITEDEIKAIIQEGRNTGEVQEVEQHIMSRVFNLGDRDLRSLMVHRSNLIWIDINDNWETVRKKLTQDIHYIYPVGEKAIENILGIVSLKDLFDHEGQDFAVKNFMQEPLFMPENTSVYNALEIFKNTKKHYAIIIDEFGVMQGMVTLNDILEALVGNMSPESTEGTILKQYENSWLVDGQCPLCDFLSFFDIAEDDELHPFYTIGGLFLAQVEHIPVVGEQIQWKRLSLKIVSMDRLRISKIAVQKILNTE